MNFVGIDYSMNSPSCCLFDGTEYRYLNLNTVKRLEGKFQVSNHHFSVEYLPKNFSNAIEKYSYMSRMFLDFIESFGKSNVALEGYSYGSKGQAILNIAENIQTLKLRLYNSSNIELILPSPPPTQIKKFATGKGNADKTMMYTSYATATGVDTIHTILDKKCEDSPVSDFVDSYWICEFLRKEIDNN